MSPGRRFGQCGETQPEAPNNNQDAETRLLSEKGGKAMGVMQPVFDRRFHTIEMIISLEQKKEDHGLPLLLRREQRVLKPKNSRGSSVAETEAVTPTGRRTQKERQGPVPHSDCMPGRGECG